MMKKLLCWYVSVSLMLRILVCFGAGALIGLTLWAVSEKTGMPMAAAVVPWVAPFGTVFVHMLKMIVVPVIFFSLVTGAASLPLGRFGHVGIKTLGWYLVTSLFAAVMGTVLALAIQPGGGADLGAWRDMAVTMGGETEEIAGRAATDGALIQVVFNLFRNPFEALAEGNFLPIIVFSILFGLALRVSIEHEDADMQQARLGRLEDLFAAIRDVMFRLVDWILEYSPIGVLALTIMNFSLYGSTIVGPYVRLTGGVVAGILLMMGVAYPVLLGIITRRNPFRLMKRMQEAVLMAFVTRSSAATLPVSLATAEKELGIRNELASFSLPLGATINMDGVCVHLPMFAVLAANMFGIDIGFGGLAMMVITTVLASVGAGGVPGGSLMLLFIILETLGLSADQVAVIVALALGINPILDMFETMNNVTGDLVCTCAVAYSEGMAEEGKE
jgi:proton glutamate symport protein